MVYNRWQSEVTSWENEADVLRSSRSLRHLRAMTAFPGIYLLLILSIFSVRRDRPALLQAHRGHTWLCACSVTARTQVANTTRSVIGGKSHQQHCCARAWPTLVDVASYTLHLVRLSDHTTCRSVPSDSDGTCYVARLWSHRLCIAYPRYLRCIRRSRNHPKRLSSCHTLAIPSWAYRSHPRISSW